MDRFDNLLSAAGEADIHNTSQLPRVIGVTTLPDKPCAAVVWLNFEPTTDQLLSMHEHLRSWHPSTP